MRMPYHHITVDDGPVTTTVVRKDPRNTPNVPILLISSYRQRRSPQLLFLQQILLAKSLPPLQKPQDYTARTAPERSKRLRWIEHS